MVEIVAYWCLVALLAGLLLTAVRLLLGPTAIDRAIALDLLAILAACVLGVLAIRYSDDAYLPVGEALVVTSFVSTVGLAFFVRHPARGSPPPRKTDR